MSAAAARRRKQLAARKAAAAGGSGGEDTVSLQLKKLLSEEALDEASAYEALQLAQSQVRKKVHAGDFPGATDLAYQSSLSLLQKSRVSVASQILTLLVEVMRETHTAVSDEWIARLTELQTAHAKAMEGQLEVLGKQETTRLHRVQRDWLRSCTNWASDLGTVKYGNSEIHDLVAQQCWTLSQLEDTLSDKTDMQCAAVQHMALAEQPSKILVWLKTLPAPTEEETKSGHTCPPAPRDALLTRSLLVFAAMENLRDGNTLLREYINTVETRSITELTASYTRKDDGMAPAHVVFGSMLLRMCEKDARTGPLFTWLLRSFKRELDRMHDPSVVAGFTTKIGKIFFNIQPPPNMMNMLDNMMNMMNAGGPGGGPNHAAMMQAMAALQQGGGFPM